MLATAQVLPRKTYFATLTGALFAICAAMGKKAKPPEAASSSKNNRPASTLPFSGRSLIFGVVGITIAVLVQWLLTAGYLSPPSPPTPPKTGMRKRTSPPAKPEPTGPPAVCPDDWTECPKVPGADWVALEALAKTLEPPSAEALDEACHQPSSLLSPRDVQGMHLLCLLPPPKDSGAVSLVAMVPRMNKATTTYPLLLLPELKKAEHVVAALSRALKIKRRGPKYQHPALFTEHGVRLSSASLLTYYPDAATPTRLLMLQGGQWLWPPVDVGHVHYIQDLVEEGVATRVVTLSLKPLVVEVENSPPEEATHIIGRAKPHMAGSGSRS